MNPNDILKACAELDGYTINGPSDDPAVVEGWCWDDKGNNCWLEELEYTSSYDAIIPLIQKQTNDIRNLVAHQHIPTGKISFMSSPAQLCEALLRAHNLWEE